MSVYQVAVKSVTLYPSREDNEQLIRAFLKLAIVDEEKWVADGREELAQHTKAITGNKNHSLN